MTILCGTDFTPVAAEAARVATAWARKTKEKLLLAHALALGGPGLFQRGSEPEALRVKLVEQLGLLAERARSAGVTTGWQLENGESDEELVRLAQHEHASLVVIGALGRRAGGRWKLGSTADRVAQACRAPLLVVRASEPFEHWLAGKRALKVCVGYEVSKTADAALVWAAGLARLGAIELYVAHAYGLYEERTRRGLKGPLPIGERDPALEGPIEAELRAHIATLRLDVEPLLRLQGGLGRAANQIVDLARALGADLAVVGNHHRSGIERAWHGSVSQGVVEHASMSVACISERE